MADEDLDGDGNFVARSTARVPPQPPRLTGEYEQDSIRLRDWTAAFYEIAVLETGLLDPGYQETVGQISFENLPNPTATTIARAQATANAAWTALEQYKSDTGTMAVRSGSFIIEGTADTASVDLDPPLTNSNYNVVVSPADRSGGPLIDSFTVIGITKGELNFVVETFAAPGAGKSVTFNWMLQPVEDS